MIQYRASGRVLAKLRLALGLLVQEERAREWGGDLARDVNGYDSAPSVFIFQVVSRRVRRFGRSDPIGVDKTRPLDLRYDGLGPGDAGGMEICPERASRAPGTGRRL